MSIYNRNSQFTTIFVKKTCLKKHHRERVIWEKDRVGNGLFVKKTEAVGSLPAPFYELGGAFRGVRCRLTDGKKACFRVENRPFSAVLSGFAGFPAGANF